MPDGIGDGMPDGKTDGKPDGKTDGKPDGIMPMAMPSAMLLQRFDNIQ